jgi:ribulose-5-phosphate 4-epimerase/fuculose-1-phosphate aldolase
VNTETEPLGGLAKWAPGIVPSAGPALTRQQQLACAFRILAAAEFSENMAGHITWMDDDDSSMLVNPWGLWWDEVSASDICRVDLDAKVLEGRWDVTPAIHIHTELHRVRADARVVVHNHPYWSTVLAALGVLPDVFHQTGCMYDGDLGFVDEYGGEIDDPTKGGELAKLIGAHPVTLLANHGVIVTAPTIVEAVYRAASFDRQCRLAYHVLVAGQAAGQNARVIAPEDRGGMKLSLLERAADVYWDGSVRKLLKREPDVLL